MTSYKFEVAAKIAVICSVRARHHEHYIIDQIQMVWFAHVLGNKKAILIDNGKNQRMYEVTYDKERDRMYVDEYEKASNTEIEGKNIRLEAKDYL